MSASRRFTDLPDEFRRQGSIMLVGHPHLNMKDEQCVEDFGSTPFILGQLWMMLVNVGLPSMSLPVHLLWWLYLVRNYPTKRVFSRLLHVVGVTYRKYLQPIKLAMMILQRTVISYKNRTIRTRTCGLSHDGTDYLCQNKPNAVMVRRVAWAPFPFDPNYFSHKFKKSGLRYGISVDIGSGEMVGAHGPFPCGLWPDIKIYKKYVLPLLQPGEQVETDRGYRHPSCRNPEDFLSKSESVAKSRAASRHEAVNGRLKNWRSLKQCFRHDHHEHKYFFFTAAVVDNLMYKKYGPCFDVSY